jgi:hypothetical protein
MHKSTPLTLERENMSESERQLLLCDIQAVLDEYFEREGNLTLDITRTSKGFSICLLFAARRIKRAKRIP